MSTPILATKLYIPPPQPSTILRTRLLEQLNRGLQHKLTLVSASAGFGKTTLISEWVQQCERPIAWLSLDESESDLNRFLNYLIAALQTIEDFEGKELTSLLQSSSPAIVESTLTILINEVATLKNPIILVLDDYHVIDSKAVDDAVGFLLSHQPPQIHIVIASREDPSLPLARLRARNQLTELRVADLRFNHAETDQFFSQLSGITLADDEVSALESRVEGWAAGLQLAAVSARGSNNGTHFIRTFAGSHQFVLDYLLEEILYQQSEDIQNFLLSTSILSRLCSSLCEAVVNIKSTSGKKFLAHIQLANLFIVPLDDKRQWFRYHHLFAEALLARLKTQQPDKIKILNQRASAWYEENDLLDEAIRHAFAADDYERVANLCELAWPEMDLSLQTETWFSWVKTLPENIIEARPVLNVNYAWALLYVGELEAALTRLEKIEAQLEQTNNNFANTDKLPVGIIVFDNKQYNLLPATVASAKGYHAQSLGDVTSTIKYTRQTLALLPSDDHFKRGGATALLGLAYYSIGELKSAFQTFSDSIDSIKKSGHGLYVIGGTFVLADIRIAQGRIHDAKRLYENALKFVQEQESPPPGTAYIYLGLGQIYLEQGDGDTAKGYLQRSEEIGEKVDLQYWQFRLCLAQAQVKRSAGNLTSALDLLTQAEKLYYRSAVPDLKPIAARKVRIWLEQGKLSKALAWQQEQNISIDDELSYQHEFEHLTLVRILIAQFKDKQESHFIHEAITLLDRLLTAANEGDRKKSVIEIHMLKSLALHAQEEMQTALKSLEDALHLAKSENFICTFIGEGETITKLLSEAAVRKIEPEYVVKLLSVLNPQQSGGKTLPSENLQLDPLSERELKVLELIAQGLSNKEICEKLHLALDTIKGHNRRIFSKLQVQRRTEAVAKARALELLPPQ